MAEPLRWNRRPTLVRPALWARLVRRDRVRTTRSGSWRNHHVSRDRCRFDPASLSMRGCQQMSSVKSPDRMPGDGGNPSQHGVEHADSSRASLGRLRLEMAMLERSDSGWARRRAAFEAVQADRIRGEEGVPVLEAAGDVAPRTSVGEDEESAGAGHGVRDVHGGSDLERLATRWRCVDGGTGDGLEFDRMLGGGLVVHAVHEWLGSTLPDPGGRSPAATRDWLPALGPAYSVIHRLRDHRSVRGESEPVVAWIGARCRPSIWALCRHRRPGQSGLDPAASSGSRERPPLDVGLALDALSVTPPGDSASDRRWSIEQAIRCDGIDVVVADGSDFSLLDTRRLQVSLSARAARSGRPVTVMLARPPWEERVRSSATTRWKVHPPRAGDREDGLVSLCRVRMPQAACMPEPGRSGSMLAGFTSDWDRPASSTMPPDEDVLPADGVLVHPIGALREQHARDESDERVPAPVASSRESLDLDPSSMPSLRPGSPPGLRRVGEAGKEDRGVEGGVERDVSVGRVRGVIADRMPDARSEARLPDDHAPDGGADDSSRPASNGRASGFDGDTLFVGLLQPDASARSGRRRRSRNGARLRGATRKADGGGLLFQGSDAGGDPRHGPVRSPGAGGGR